MLVFGAGGTGKSSLGTTLSHESDVDPSYRVSSIDERGKVAGIPFAQTTIYPGQERRRKDRGPEIMRRLANADFDVIIHVVSFGYHSLTVHDWKDHDLALDAADVASFMDKWTTIARAFEIDALNEVRHALENAGGRLRMITLVNKQDIWWQQRREVERHYNTGEYGRIIQEIGYARGRDRFDHSLLQCSLRLLNFRVPERVLQATSAGYDHVQQSTSVTDLERQIRAILVE